MQGRSGVFPILFLKKGNSVQFAWRLTLTSMGYSPETSLILEFDENDTVPDLVKVLSDLTQEIACAAEVVITSTR